jgi:hypothetical protein
VQVGAAAEAAVAIEAGVLHDRHIPTQSRHSVVAQPLPANPMSPAWRRGIPAPPRDCGDARVPPRFERAAGMAEVEVRAEAGRRLSEISHSATRCPRRVRGTTCKNFPSRKSLGRDTCMAVGASEGERLSLRTVYAPQHRNR